MELTTAVAGRHLIITSEFEASDIVHNLVAQFVPNMERCGGQLFSGPVAIRATVVKSEKDRYLQQNIFYIMKQ